MGTPSPDKNIHDDVCVARRSPRMGMDNLLVECIYGAGLNPEYRGFVLSCHDGIYGTARSLAFDLYCRGICARLEEEFFRIVTADDIDNVANFDVAAK